MAQNKNSVTGVKSIRQSTPSEKGEVISAQVLLYLKAMNRVNREYLEKIESALAKWQEIDREYKGIMEEAEVANIKKKISQL